jgi:uncharacterized heparinase superfamily protein
MPDEVLCLVDAGPLGFLSTASHGHADALAFTLTVGGRPVVVDAGTYCYHSDPQWRDYFRGTAAHNTVLVDGLDQSVHAGMFLWTEHADARVLGWMPDERGGRVVGEHDGYRCLADPVTHRRALVLDGGRLDVHDLLKGHAAHAVEWRLHLSPACAATLEGETCRVTWPSGSMVVRLDAGLAWRLARGEASAGWHSSRFNVREPTYTLLGAGSRQLPFEIKVVMEMAPGLTETV